MNNYKQQRNSLNESVPVTSDRLKALYGDFELEPMQTPILDKAKAEQDRANTRQAVWTVIGLTLLAVFVCYLSWGQA